TLATVMHLEEALGISLRADKKATPRGRPVAGPPELGGYARPAVSWLEGDYLTLRPSFEVEGAIFAYRTAIRWDDKRRCLSFEEGERLDAPYAQKGVVAVPHQSGHIYLYTNEQGQMRLAILGRPLISKQMYGVLTTLHARAGGHLVPVSVPLALIPATA